MVGPEIEEFYHSEAYNFLVAGLGLSCPFKLRLEK